MNEIAAYTAGFFDGEGCLRIYRNTRGAYQAVAKISNNNRVVLDWLVEKWGGRVYSHGHRPSGQNPSWVWTLYMRSDITKFVTAIRPYLRVKAQEADLLLSFFDHYAPGKNQYQPPSNEQRTLREDYRLAMAQANRRGPSLASPDEIRQVPVYGGTP